jgi:hypothetical protein
MPWINQLYLDGPYRTFGNAILRYLADSLIQNKISNRKLPQNFSASGLNTVGTPKDALFDEPWGIWNVVRFWGTNFVLALDCYESWAQEWLDYGLTTLPNVSKLNWIAWDKILLEFVYTNYLDFWKGLWKDRELTEEQAQQFWQTLWVMFLQSTGNESKVSSNEQIDNLLNQFASESPRNFLIMEDTSQNIATLCKASNLPIAGPAWAVLPIGAPPDIDDPQWDIPLQVLGAVSGLSIEPNDVYRYCQKTALIWQILQATLREIHEEPPMWEFWFPLDG